MSDHTFLALFASAAYLLAAVFFAAGFYLRSKTRRLLDSALVTKGKVVALEPSVSMSSEMIYRAFRVFFTFRDARDIEHRIQSSSYANPGDYKVGDVVEVFYNPQSPQEAIIDPEHSLQMARICLFGASLAALTATGMIIAILRSA